MTDKPLPPMSTTLDLDRLEALADWLGREWMFLNDPKTTSGYTPFGFDGRWKEDVLALISELKASRSTGGGGEDRLRANIDGTGHVVISAPPKVEGDQGDEPLRLCGYCKMWQRKPCGEGCVFDGRGPTWEEALISALPDTGSGITERCRELLAAVVALVAGLPDGVVEAHAAPIERVSEALEALSQDAIADLRARPLPDHAHTSSGEDENLSSSRDHAHRFGVTLELYEAELCDLLRELEDVPSAGDAALEWAIALSVGHWRCIDAFLSSAMLSEQREHRDDLNPLPNPDVEAVARVSETKAEKIARLQREIGARQMALQYLVLGDPFQGMGGAILTSTQPDGGSEQ